MDIPDRGIIDIPDTPIIDTPDIPIVDIVDTPFVTILQSDLHLPNFMAFFPQRPPPAHLDAGSNRPGLHTPHDDTADIRDIVDLQDR